MKADPAQQKQWAAAYDSASFWATVQQAKALQSAGRLAQARTLLTGLLAHPHANAVGAVMVLANIEARLKNNAAAERAYRQVLASQPRNADALIGLAAVLNAEGKTAEATQIASRLTPAERARLGGGGGGGGGTGGGGQAETLRKEAKEAEIAGNNQLAEQKFKEAIAADTKTPWTRLDYARFLAGSEPRRGGIHSGRSEPVGEYPDERAGRGDV